VTNNRSETDVTEPHLEGTPRDEGDVDPDVPADDPRLGGWAQERDDIPAGFTVPAKWLCGRKGIFKVVDRQNGPINVRVSYGAILPIAIHVDPSGHQLVELLWWDGKRWVDRLVPREMAKAGKKLVAAMGNLGFPATDSGGREVENWLALAESVNRQIIPEFKVARWLGWQPDGTFIAAADGELRVEPMFDEQANALRAHRTKGTLEDWQKGIAAIERLQVAKFALYAGLAAPLLDVLDVKSFTVDFSGRSTRGKTTAAKIGLSCFADPSQDGDGVANWQTTVFAIEKRLNLVRGLPVLLDETRLVSSPEVVDKVLYAVGMNHGRSRSGGYASSLPWSCVVITTGEQPAVSHTSHQGASARVITITQPPFGNGDVDNGQAAMTVGRAVDENYGHAGPLFVAKLREILAQPGGKDSLIRAHREFQEKYRGTSDISGRRAPLVATLALAAKLCHTWNLTPGLTPPPNRVWLELFTQDSAEDNRPELALDVVREWVASNGAAMWLAGPGNTGRQSPPGGWIGRALRLSDTWAVALMPNRLKTVLERHGITLEAVLPAWKESGWLVKSNEKDRPWDKKHRLDGTLVRLYTFQPEAFGEYEPPE